MPNHYFSLFFLLGLSIPIGISLLIIINVKEFVYDYTDCLSQENPSFSCAEILEMDMGIACTCAIPLELTEALDDDVWYMYTYIHSSNVKTRDHHHLLEKLGDNSGLKAKNYILYVEYNDLVKSFADRKLIIIYPTLLPSSKYSYSLVIGCIVVLVGLVWRFVLL